MLREGELVVSGRALGALAVLEQCFGPTSTGITRRFPLVSALPHTVQHPHVHPIMHWRSSETSPHLKLSSS